VKKLLITISCALLISSGLVIFTYELLDSLDKKNEVIVPHNEHFDPSLLRLRSIAAFTSYCDSVYGKSEINASDSEQYAAIVAETLRDRFYHGYSYYYLGQNSIAYFFAPLIREDLRAIVIPNDILKHPMAACSQQSIVGMEVFKRKGIDVRKVGFYAKEYGGHFCFEAFFNGKWHFFDPDMEPKLSVMRKYHFPGIAELAQNDSLLHSLYTKEDKNFVEKLFLSYSYGSVNKFPAPNAIVFQYMTKFLSYFSWVAFILLYFFVGRKVNYTTKNKNSTEGSKAFGPQLRA